MKVRSTVARKYKETELDKKWDSYTGTGITAEKDKDALALREQIGGGKFAVVKLHGGCWTSSLVQVLEEIDTSNISEAKERFNAVAQKLGFAPKPVRTPGLLGGFVVSTLR